MQVETTYSAVRNYSLVSKRKTRQASVYNFLAIEFVFHISLFPTNLKSVWKEQRSMQRSGNPQAIQLEGQLK